MLGFLKTGIDGIKRVLFYRNDKMAFFFCYKVALLF